MKKIVLVGLAASVPALAAEPATVPEIRRAAGGAPAASRTEAGSVKLRTPGAEIKRAESKEHKTGYGEYKTGIGTGEHKERKTGYGAYGTGIGAGEHKEHKTGYGEYKTGIGAGEHKDHKTGYGEYKSPGEFKEGKFRGDAAAPAEAPPVQREAPVRY